MDIRQVINKQKLVYLMKEIEENGKIILETNKLEGIQGRKIQIKIL